MKEGLLLIRKILDYLNFEFISYNAAHSVAGI